ncbi:glycine cleavage system protein GcvH [Salinarchaeum sp. IM2453]|uniref:glycine cleavage system protein GcvH n=1 Tax=Salinarchaeum sp. IM2453 TaxID=2862870 RepID=UPI001C83E173|nr:glycine cleavage system protein GcvH [Salinarchaeum sp. IM2453]QZA89277.1 glycine cleavage system protein GcvH [Salinarchaeum sp. IM2453]
MSYEVKDDLYYTEDHEWARIENGTATIGLADFAQDEFGDLVFFELPQVGDEVAQGDAFGVAESIKAVADIYSPVSGEVVDVNEEILDAPELVNDDPYGDGWIIKVEMSDEAEVENLYDVEAYQEELLD